MGRTSSRVIKAEFHESSFIVTSSPHPRGILVTSREEVSDLSRMPVGRVASVLYENATKMLSGRYDETAPVEFSLYRT